MPENSCFSTYDKNHKNHSSKIKMKNKKNSIPFIDLKTQQQKILPQLEKNIHQVLHHGKYIMGPEIVELEQKLAEYVGIKHCITVSSGTDALLIAMMALEVGPDDEVITTPFSFIATAETIALLGPKPISRYSNRSSLSNSPT
jgi:UDP-2-acetamido-2-deoxy-ribo-hexuluronate aminotransferase